MKALTLTQPWATAIAIGIKQWETRSWGTSLRGRVAIHAAKGFPGWAKRFAREQQAKGILPPGELPLGKIVCVADLVDCRPTVQVAREIGEMELALGDYAAGRYAFKFENVVPLLTPVYACGALGFWSVEWDLHHDISKQVAKEHA